jgi:hypothetical protein
MPASVVPTFRKPRKVGQPILRWRKGEKLKVRQPAPGFDPCRYQWSGYLILSRFLRIGWGDAASHLY